MIHSNLLFPWYSFILLNFCWLLQYELKAEGSLHACPHNLKNNLNAASSCTDIISEAWMWIAILV